MGSAIALAMAIRHPEYVIGLGLISGGARLRVHQELLDYAADRTTFLKAADLLVSYSFSINTPPRMVELASKRMLETRQSVFNGDLKAKKTTRQSNRFNVMALLKMIHQPTLVICGADDLLTPLRYAQYLSSNIPNARLSVIPEAGHMVMLEQPRLVAENLVSFLQDISFHPGVGF